MLHSLKLISIAVVVTLTALPVLAATMTPSGVLAHAASLQGKSVTVSGSVAHFQRSSTLMGTISAYQLCDTKCIVVIDQRNASHQNGDRVTASGTFHVQYKGPRRSFNNVVMISK